MGSLEALILMLILTSCSSFNGERQAVYTAAMDHHCPVARVEVLHKRTSLRGSGEYLLKVCGQTFRYRRAGSVYYQEPDGAKELHAASG